MLIGIALMMPMLYQMFGLLIYYAIVDRLKDVRDVVCEQKIYRKMRGGAWFLVLPTCEHIIDDHDYCGWRRYPPRDGDICIYSEVY